MPTYRPSIWFLIAFFIRRYLRQEFSAQEVRVFTRNAHTDYKRLLAKVHGVGNKNPMRINMYGALVFMAFITGNPDRLNERHLEGMIDFIYSRPFLVKLMGTMDINKSANFARFEKRIQKSAQWGEEHKELTENWAFNFPKIHEDGIYYYFSQCPIASYFKENGLEEYTKYLCAIDYKSINLVGGQLIRKGTIAQGSPMCDFWIVPNKIKNPR